MQSWMYGRAIFECPGQSFWRAGQNEEGPAWPDGCGAVRLLERQLDESVGGLADPDTAAASGMTKEVFA